MESMIRDDLAKKLELIEQGLVLVDTEYYLSPVNIHFTKGFIDILAKDCHGRLLIIEVKRSNQASRQAIHELLKYKTAIQSTFCLSSNEVRLLILSTDWKELLIPFSEFTRKYTAEGYKITTNNSFHVMDCNRVHPLDVKKIQRGMSDKHAVYFFHSELERKNFKEN